MGASRAHRPRRALPSRRPARATDTSDAERDEGYRRDGSFDSSRHRFICGLFQYTSTWGEESTHSRKGGSHGEEPNCVLQLFNSCHYASEDASEEVSSAPHQPPCACEFAQAPRII